jgi:hypothetical protein
MVMSREWTQSDYQKLRLTGNLKEGRETRSSPKNLERWDIYSNEWRDGIYTAMSGEMGYIQQ